MPGRLVDSDGGPPGAVFGAEVDQQRVFVALDAWSMGWIRPLLRASDGPFAVTVLGAEGGPSSPSSGGIGVFSRCAGCIGAFQFAPAGRMVWLPLSPVWVRLSVFFLDSGGEQGEQHLVQGCLFAGLEGSQEVSLHRGPGLAEVGDHGVP